MPKVSVVVWLVVCSLAEYDVFIVGGNTELIQTLKKALLMARFTMKDMGNVFLILEKQNYTTPRRRKAQNNP